MTAKRSAKTVASVAGGFVNPTGVVGSGPSAAAGASVSVTEGMDDDAVVATTGDVTDVVVTSPNASASSLPPHAPATKNISNRHAGRRRSPYPVEGTSEVILCKILHTQCAGTWIRG